ncbi:hypothetical protein [Actinoplanes derwentensis]|uniref:Uncharacterized protein n=1 Tax=Actinoplanes derwentensis TaxID=113562 RepID=A0A1H2AX74_9ACTN|nr:hypothetical protein [Actinoplanes derwentensis]GID87265.1 hypothetical protein Ade03nite_61890 [Actinoplanes derwentensis]SDT50523.1 hypothetical protein SAMN04489716_4162 [Actinoplanes derwentensis]
MELVVGHDTEGDGRAAAVEATRILQALADMARDAFRMVCLNVLAVQVREMGIRCAA